MIELRILCDKSGCETAKELDFDEYVLNMDNAITLAGYECIQVGGRDFWFCAECLRDWDELQTERENKELEFVEIKD